MNDLTINKKEHKMKFTYPELIPRPSKDKLYSFSVYQADGEKEHSDFYDADGARKIWDYLKENETFGFYCTKGNLENNYLDDINSKSEII